MRSSPLRSEFSLATLALSLVFALALVPGCSGEEPSSQADVEAGSPKALESFWEATRKSGSYDVQTTQPGHDSYEMKATFTFDGNRFRIDYDESDVGEARSIISTDGAHVYFAMHESKTASQSQASPDYYVSLFSKPDAELQDQGVDQETGAQKYYFLMEETYAEGSESEPWFEKDRTYYVKDDTLVKLVTRGGSPGTADNELIEHEFLFGDVDLDPEIDEAMFVLPYPITE